MNDIAYELFGEMRCLTPEESEKKKDMYRRMSTSLDRKLDKKYFVEKLSFAVSNGFTLGTKEDVESLASFLSDEISKRGNEYNESNFS